MDDARLLVRIESWDLNLHVGVRSRASPEINPNHPLLLAQWVDLRGVVLSSPLGEDLPIRIALSPRSRDLLVELAIEDPHVGFVVRSQPLTASLYLPEDMLQVALTALGST